MENQQLAEVLKVLEPAALEFCGQGEWDAVKAEVLKAGSVAGSSATAQNVLALAKARFGSRSEAGRYAANIRWQMAGNQGEAIPASGLRYIGTSAGTAGYGSKASPDYEDEVMDLSDAIDFEQMGVNPREDTLRYAKDDVAGIRKTVDTLLKEGKYHAIAQIAMARPSSDRTGAEGRKVRDEFVKLIDDLRTTPPTTPKRSVDALFRIEQLMSKQMQLAHEYGDKVAKIPMYEFPDRGNFSLANLKVPFDHKGYVGLTDKFTDAERYQTSMWRFKTTMAQAIKEREEKFRDKYEPIKDLTDLAYEGDF